MATNTNTEETLADQIAMGLGGGLMILSVVIFGLIEVFSGSPYSPINGEGNAAAGAVFGPYIRGLVLTIGTVILMLYAIYVFAVKQGLD